MLNQSDYSGEATIADHTLAIARQVDGRQGLEGLRDGRRWCVDEVRPGSETVGSRCLARAKEHDVVALQALLGRAPGTTPG